MKEKIKQLITSINDVISFDRLDVDDEMLYDVVFKTHTEIILPMIQDLGMDFDYYDPDGSYSEDTEAYLRAIKDFKKRLETLVAEECSECHQLIGYHKMDCSQR